MFSFCFIMCERTCTTACCVSAYMYIPNFCSMYIYMYTNSSVPCTGFQYTAWEGELMQGDLHTRYKDHAIKRPHTPLAK